MDNKYAPPSYGEAAQNQGYAAGPGDQASGAPPPPPGYGGYPQGYPQGYSGPQQAGYGQPPPPGGYYQPQPQAGGFAYSSNVVVNQPTPQTGVVVNNVPDHMGLAIFVTLCCCWPLGLVAIMRVQESRRALERGDYPSASTYSQEARRYSMWAIAGGCISIVVAIIIIVIYVVTLQNNTYYY